MTEKERASRDAGREAVRLSKELPELKRRYKEALESSKYGTRSTSFKATELDIAKNTLINALVKTGHSQSEITRILSDLNEVAMTAKATHMEEPDEEHVIEHHGILGMKWGIRRYQHPDGTLTALGKKHLDDGKTDKVVEKFRQKKADAIAKGDRKFAEKNIDYMTNDDINKLNERIRQRNTILGLKKATEGINAERFKTWVGAASEVLSKGANMAETGVRLYNAVAKINNTFSDKKMKLIKEGGDDQQQKTTYNETYENGKLTRSQKQYTDEFGNKHDVIKTYTDKEKEKRPETIKNVYGEDGNLKSVSRTYTDDKGNNVTDTRAYGSTKSESKESSSSKSSGEKSSKSSDNSWEDWTKAYKDYAWKKSNEAVQKFNQARKEEDEYINDALAAIRKDYDERRKKGGKK